SGSAKKYTEEFKRLCACISNLTETDQLQTYLHVQAGLSEIFGAFIPRVTLPFIDNLPMRGVHYDARNESEVTPGVQKFMHDHAQDVTAILRRLIKARVTFSSKKSSFGRREIGVFGFVCNEAGRAPGRSKVAAIDRMGPCESVSKVRRLLGAVRFYRMFYPHYANVAEPLYGLLQKGAAWAWTEKCDVALSELKMRLSQAPVLRPLSYARDAGQIFLSVDASLRAVSAPKMASANIDPAFDYLNFEPRSSRVPSGTACFASFCLCTFARLALFCSYAPVVYFCLPGSRAATPSTSAKCFGFATPFFSCPTQKPQS
ncbi:MAG: hypothetical protein BJ554DRAFT_4085, partial [Olpidium bornovanus]